MSAYDLYLLAGGRWTLHMSFDEDEQDNALETAIDMKQTGAHKAIYLLWPRYGKILYSHIKSGTAEVDYRTINQIIEKDSKNPGTGAAEFEGLIVSTGGAGGGTRAAPRMNIRMKKDPGLPEPTDPSTIPAAVGIGGFVASGILFLVLSSSGARLGTTLLTTGLILGIAAVLAHQLYNQNVEKNRKILEEIERSKHKETTKTMLYHMTQSGKSLRWNKSSRRMQSDTHFAMVLYLAGANAAAAEKFDFKKNALHDYFSELFAQLNIPDNQGKSFLNNVKEYLLYPRYHAMFETGYSDAIARINNPQASISLEKAFQEWEQAEQAAKEGKSHTKTAAVMFTDIENYTAQTQEKGNEWLMDVIKAHNEIIRAVLKKYRGREVKHTGDGIMASFTAVPDALNAAIAIQRGIYHFSKNMPGRAFKLRIGISDGEPIHLDGDIFGTPVNLASRVMNHVDGDEIALSQNIPTLCPSGQYKYVELKNVTLKGFGEAQSIYKLVWQETLPAPAPASPDNTAAALQASQN